MPGINDSPEEVSKILELAADAGAVSVAGVTLHLRGEVRDIFFDWLRNHRPDLIPYYEHLYSRGAYARSEKRREHSELVRYRSRRQRRGTTKQSGTPAPGEPPSKPTPQPSLF
jgi:DNA repair photolyase